MLKPIHIKYVGGTWILDDATEDVLFKFVAGIFGSDGRMNQANFMTREKVYHAQIKQFVTNQHTN